MKRTRYRILFPRPAGSEGYLPCHDTITHWIFAADQKHKPIHYGHANFAFMKDGRKIEGYQKHKEF
jgi:hypothetical protein